MTTTIRVGQARERLWCERMTAALTWVLVVGAGRGFRFRACLAGWDRPAGSGSRANREEAVGTRGVRFAGSVRRATTRGEHADPVSRDHAKLHGQPGFLVLRLRKTT